MRQACACNGSTLLVDKRVSEQRVRAGAADSLKATLVLKRVVAERARSWPGCQSPSRMPCFGPRRGRSLSQESHRLLKGVSQRVPRSICFTES